MSEDFDVIIVGSGPAGVSAAFPLLAGGLRVLMVDGGRENGVALPEGNYIDQRLREVEQWKWMIGSDFHGLRDVAAVSPKLRIPTQAWVFDGFAESNRVQAADFFAKGSLAAGGFSNAWGCGVAKLGAAELATFPFPAADLEASYAAVAARMGISGANDDDMSAYFGFEQSLQAPVPIDRVQDGIFKRYRKQRERLVRQGFRLGRSRVAVLTEERGHRRNCERSGLCLWGCARKALYSAIDEIPLLQRYPTFHYQPGFVVDSVVGRGELRAIMGRDRNGPQTLRARRIVLAAGTLASTRLALQASGLTTPVPMHSCPTAAFLLWLPGSLGVAREAAFGLGQLSFAITLDEGVTGFGSLFNTTGIPLAEFARYLPLRKRYGIDLLGALLSSCVVCNLFLPGHLTHASLALAADGSLRVSGGYLPTVAPLMEAAERRLRRSFARLGALLLPTSFQAGRPGSDLHYASSLPMRREPGPGETDATGLLFGTNGIHVVDGASLSALSEKSLTLTVMANADRIGKIIAFELERSTSPVGGDRRRRRAEGSNNEEGEDGQEN